MFILYSTIETSTIHQERDIEAESDVLLLVERNNTDYLDGMYSWYKTIIVKIDDCQQRTYTVHIQRNFQVIDVLVAFEQYLESENLVMSDFYNRNCIISRDKWIHDFQNETVVFLSEGSYSEGS